jgi:hypothetical protein
MYYPPGLGRPPNQTMKSTQHFVVRPWSMRARIFKVLG